MQRSGRVPWPTFAQADLIADAVAVGRGLGLRIDDPVVLRDSLNLVIHLRPAPVVARLAVRTSLVRSVAAITDSLALAAFLAGEGLPVGPPVDEVDPGPHLGPRTGRPITLWRLLEPATGGEGLVDPGEAGRSLRRIHEAAARFAGPLGHAGPVIEIQRLADLIAPARPEAADHIRRFADRLEPPEGPVQPIHGDAHLGNVLVTTEGQVWIDWEEAWLGPVAWDVGALEHRHRVFGEAAPETEAAVAAYGPVDRAAVDGWAPVGTLWAFAWGTFAAIHRGEELGDNATVRLRWLEEQFP